MHDNLTLAESDFKNALKVLPTYSQAMEGLGKVEYFKGNNLESEKYFAQALSTLSLAQYSTDLADFYSVTGDKVKSNQEIALATSAYGLASQTGVNTDLEQSLFLSDHEINLAQALEMAKRAYQDRPSIYGSDYLAWAYYKNGNFTEAAKYNKESLRLGEYDPLILFHQGMIAYKNNDFINTKKYLTESKKINPNFSILYKKTLEDTLSSIK